MNVFAYKFMKWRAKVDKKENPLEYSCDIKRRDSLKHSSIHDLWWIFERELAELKEEGSRNIKMNMLNFNLGKVFWMFNVILF